MPGIKGGATRRPTNDPNALIQAVEVVDEALLEMPSTEGYVSSRKRTTKTESGPVDEIEYFWTRAKLAAWLALCPKVSVHIPLDRENGETDPAKARPHPVYYDGFRIDIPKGKTVMAPLPIAQIIENMQTERRTAGSLGLDMYLIDPGDPDDHGYEIPALAGVG